MRRNLREALVWSQPYDFLQRRRSAYAGQYARLFPDLPPLDCAEDLLYALGGSGGLADAPGTVDASGAAGWPLFGQFIAHDITADRSPLGKRADASLIRNFRTTRIATATRRSATHTSCWSYVFGLAHSLIELPLEITGELPVQEYRSLAVRDLSGTTSSKKLRSAFRVSGSDPSGGASWSFGMAELLAFAQSVRI